MKQFSFFRNVLIDEISKFLKSLVDELFSNAKRDISGNTCAGNYYSCLLLIGSDINRQLFV
ncbi:MAG: hypothetical protein IPO83_00450 [Chitinophagaceae bacterium]|nr:hypothetical protein [Chitinophagaceae bacterium]